jgi:hypothetical protein
LHHSITPPLQAEDENENEDEDDGRRNKPI